ncbi:hypothetical protein EK21DRAFT_61795 [Setomelanomma holmii]|uniref:Protein kinase domain-containing protein n=1 Tax=Setomelanomma holmii TaxID=210430 RepID=A0A9P4HCK9_9PLEO|nr:hypothetical protein EK21DRAFT_61795 [Setomelanomma holmii]
METISRLTQLYSDTKTSCDAVVEQDTKDTQPETNALHRKFRIQKDRLITWGVDWSDNTKGTQGDIDESVDQAGLTETVTSVLGTIREISDEAERLRTGAPVGKTLSGEKRQAASDAPSWVAADRSRYEDLIKDLTTAIDILYDLSRTRRTQRGTSRNPSPKPRGSTETPRPTTTPVYRSAAYSASDLTLVNPATFPINAQANVAARSNLPAKLDQSDLILPEEEPPPYESVGTSSIRVIVSPPTDRLERLLSILTKLSSNQPFHGTLKCLGYFEDSRQPRFGLVFELPTSVYSGPSDSHKSVEDLRPVTLLSVLQTGSKSLHNSNSATPPLEDRFRLAFTLALTFSKIHGDNFVHKDINSSNILVFRKTKRQSANSRALQYTLRSPVICSFDLFSEYDLDTSNTMPTLNIYRHPDDPKFTGVKDAPYGPHFDMYSLGLILLEIGLWLPLGDLWKPKYTLNDFKRRIEDVYIRRLASKCGTAYMQVVRDCFWAADGAEGLHDPAQLYNRVILRLQRCCMLDESEPGFDINELRPGVTPIQSASPLKRKSVSQPQIASEVPSSPSYRSAKRYIIEKGSQALERTKSLNKSSPKQSPDPGLSRNPSRSSQHSIRKSISESLRLMSPKEEASESMEWEQRDPLEESGTLVDTPPNSQDRSDVSSLSKERVVTAASIIQRAWRASLAKSDSKDVTLKGYKEKITLIQKAWRESKQKRTNTIEALLTDGLRHWPQAALGYPTPEPEVVRSIEATSSIFITSSIQIETDMEPVSRPRLRLFPAAFPPSVVQEWHTAMLPRLERLIERVLKDSDETISIDLVAIGETQEKARPTIFVTCSSVAKVKAILARRFRYDEAVFDLKIRRGKIRRSKMSRSSRRVRPPHRSMMNTDNYNADMAVMNPYHQEKPLCGASIGAFNGEHLPPVSYGGVILVDDEPVGMTVHHLLDAPSDEESDAGDDMSYQDDPVLSSATSNNNNPWLMGMGAQPGLELELDDPVAMWDLELSDDEDIKSDDDDADSFEFSDSESEPEDDDTTQDSLSDSTFSHVTQGDIDGIQPGAGNGIKITQPAIDDVDEDFFPNDDDRDEEHLLSHELGHVHASSGIRRWKRAGIVHEIDWALLKLNESRLQPYNICQGGRRFCIKDMEPDQRLIAQRLREPVDRRHYRPEEDEYPNGVAKADSLGGMNVHCFGRTTGLQGGMINPAMSSVRIYRRKTFSRSWSVAGGFGVGGDSGAWVVQNGTHQVVGHVLAWCQRNHIAYLCPMEVLLEDIKRTLGAQRINLPGSAEQTLYATKSRSEAKRAIKSSSGASTEVDDLEVGVQGLGIVDSAVDMRSAFGTHPSSGAAGGVWMRNGTLNFPQTNGNSAGDSDKENLPALRSRIMKVKQGRDGGLEMAVVP